MSSRAIRARLGLIAVGAALLLNAADAHATLTDSEKGQVRGYVSSSDLSTVFKLRSLVARPDLSEAEVGDVLSSALRATPFDDRAERYIHALVFGPASLASRSVVAPAVVRGLLARADVVMASQPGNPNQWGLSARDELRRIHAYVARLTSEARDTERQGMASLETRALQAIADAYREHLTRHAAFLAFRSRAEGPALLLRLQVARTAVKTTSGSSSRVDVASWLGLGDAARGLFVRTGVLIDDGGLGPDARLAQVVQMVESVPDALQGVTTVLVSKTPVGALGALDQLMAIRVPLGPQVPKRAGLWPDSAVTADPDQALFEAAYVASLRSARRQLAADPKLAEQVRATMQRAAGKGTFGHLAGWMVESSLDRDASTSAAPVSPEMLLAATMTMLLLDAQRTTDLAAMRLMAGRPEPMDQLLLGLRALTSPGKDGGPSTAQVGRTSDAGTQLERAEPKLDGTLVASVKLGGHEYAFEYRSDGGVSSVRLDGQPLRLADLSTVRVPTTAGDRWEAGGRTFVRLNGAPRVGVLGDAQVVLEPAASDSAGADAIYTEASTPDHAVEAVLQLTGDGAAGQIVRASTGSGGFHGVGALVRCQGGGCYAKLVSMDGEGHDRELAREVKVSDGQASDGLRVRLSIRGQDVSAKVAGKQLRGRLGQPLPPGHVGWMVRPGSRLIIRDWAVEPAK